MSSRLHDVVGWTLVEAEELLKPLRLIPENRPEELVRKNIEIRGNPYQLRSAGWTDERGTLNVKYCRMQSGKLDIAMLMVYPTTRPDLLPVFVAEWVVVGDRCRVAVLDVHTAGKQPNLDRELAEAFDPIGERRQKQLPTDTDCPEWFRELSKPWAIFSSCTIDRAGALHEAFREYLQASVDLYFLPRQSLCEGGPEADSVVKYKHYGFAHTPGRAILHTTFGAEYAEAFLRWHFGPPNQSMQQPAEEASIPGIEAHR